MTLLASLNCEGETHLVVGGNCNIAALRVSSILACGAKPILIQKCSMEDFPISLQDHIKEDSVAWIQEEYSTNHLKTLGRSEVDHVVDKVFVTLLRNQEELKRIISKQCQRLRIPINVSDLPELCTFTLLSTYSSGDFHMGVTTSGKGCKLASRIKRELVSALPNNIAEICNRVGELRQHLQLHDNEVGADDDDAVTTLKLNSLVHEFNMTKEQQASQRARFLSQIVEYYPLAKLADISVADLTSEYSAEVTENNVKRQKTDKPQKGTISLVGSGPGSVSMLTLGALLEIHSADLVLADKLVPQQVLDLIPQKRTRLFIARKFPGNAERAQQELLELGLASLQKGEKVVRLKQGDPYIFGRGGEEYAYFSRHGFVPTVLPGITSALAAPLYSTIPATHRDVADQVLICTGTGRRGTLPNMPEFVSSRTTVFLMALHRIVELIPYMTSEKQWPVDLPVAIVERASCPDQRVIRTTLGKAAAAVEALGSRPPGLLIAGYACKILTDPQDISADEDATGDMRVNENRSVLTADWRVEEGLPSTDIGGLLQKLTVH